MELMESDNYEDRKYMFIDRCLEEVKILMFRKETMTGLQFLL